MKVWIVKISYETECGRKETYLAFANARRAHNFIQNNFEVLANFRGWNNPNRNDKGDGIDHRDFAEIHRVILNDTDCDFKTRRNKRKRERLEKLKSVSFLHTSTLDQPPS
jgi:hypothetical protein